MVTNSGARLTVATRNVSFGFDPDALMSGRVSPADAWGHVAASRPPARAEAWADEIAGAQPDVVGLQEVALFQTAPLDAPGPATDVALDFLQLLLDALTLRGLSYAVAASVDAFAAELPLAGPQPMRVRLTDRNVTLVRSGGASPPRVLETEAAHFATSLPIPVIGPLTRGWTAVDVEVGGRAVRVVNTHLEGTAGADEARRAQAAELLAGPMSGPATVLLGDLNCGPPSPDAAFALLTGQLADAWAAAGTGDGLTCCEDGRAAAGPYSRRIDHVLLGSGVQPVSAAVVGAAPAGEVFASDHAGVVATLLIG